MSSIQKKPADITLVRDLMTVGVPTCRPDTSITDLARSMLENDWESVVVLEEGHAVGVVDRMTLVNVYGKNGVAALVAEEVMRPDVPTVPADIPLVVAAQLMIDKGVRSLYQMHHAGGIEYPAAQITYWHLLRHLAAREASDLSDLGILADRQMPLEAFLKRRDEARRRAEGNASPPRESGPKS